jgi:GTP1/Obg family GTP-binding protein
MRDIIVMLDNVYAELLDRTADSEERQEVLSKIDEVQNLIEDLDELV